MTRSSNPRMPLTLTAATALILGLGGHATAQQPVVHHKTVKVGELDIFYREAAGTSALKRSLCAARRRSGQVIKLRGGVHEVRRREAFRVRAVDGGQRVAGLVAAALPLPEPGLAHRGPQLQGLRLLTAGDRDGLTERSFGVRRVLRMKGQQELPLESVQFRLKGTDPSLLN